MKISALALTAALIAISGCAKPPSKIAAATISSAEYADLSCTGLVRELASVSAKLESAEKSTLALLVFAIVTLCLQILIFCYIFFVKDKKISNECN
jgi:hypothetical protein